MKDSTKVFLERVENGEPIRESIVKGVHESRFFFYTDDMKPDNVAIQLAKNSEESALAEYILKNQIDLGIKVRLTKRGARRLAQQMVLKYRGV